MIKATIQPGNDNTPHLPIRTAVQQHFAIKQAAPKISVMTRPGAAAIKTYPSDKDVSVSIPAGIINAMPSMTATRSEVVGRPMSPAAIEQANAGTGNKKIFYIGAAIIGGMILLSVLGVFEKKRR